MRNLFKTIEEKCKQRDKIKKQLKENKYPKSIYKKENGKWQNYISNMELWQVGKL